ncbi:MAG: hypothetical protein JW829_19790 [Pirellulales bacterium]|nr:hypothetical protein [Pirellulales bacterium]
MSEHERWVVYPLLFLALGVALRDKLLKRVDTDSMVADRVVVSPALNADTVICRRLEVQSSSGQSVAAIAEDPGSRSGRIETYDTHGRVTGVVGSTLVGLWPWKIPWQTKPQPGPFSPSPQRAVVPPSGLPAAPGSASD